MGEAARESKFGGSGRCGGGWWAGWRGASPPTERALRGLRRRSGHKGDMHSGGRCSGNFLPNVWAIVVHRGKSTPVGYAWVAGSVQAGSSREEGPKRGAQQNNGASRRAAAPNGRAGCVLGAGDVRGGQAYADAAAVLGCAGVWSEGPAAAACRSCEQPPHRALTWFTEGAAERCWSVCVPFARSAARPDSPALCTHTRGAESATTEAQPKSLACGVEVPRRDWGFPNLASTCAVWMAMSSTAMSRREWPDPGRPIRGPIVDRLSRYCY